MTTRRSTLTRLAAAATAVVALAVPFAAPAGAAEAGGATTANPVRTGAGYDGVFNGHAATQEVMVIEGNEVIVFCIEENVPYDRTASTAYTASGWSASGVSGLGSASDIAVRSASIGTPLADANLEAVAVQLAVWTYTSGIDHTTVPNAAVVDRVNELRAAAGTRGEQANSFVLTADAARDGDNAVVTVAVRDAAGAPHAGENVTVTVAGAAPSVATTAPDGTAAVTVPVAAEGSTITVAWSGTLPAGTVLVPAGATQKVVTAAPVPLTRNVSLTVGAAPVDDVTPTTEPPADDTPPPAAPPAPAPPQELPFTGTETTLGLLAVAAAAVGGAIYYRRRTATR